MSDPRTGALACVQSLVEQLESMTDLREEWNADNGGWTSRSRDAWINEFRDVESRLLAGDSDFDYLGHHLIRVLDHHGVIGGPILETAAAFQRDLLTLTLQEGGGS